VVGALVLAAVTGCNTPAAAEIPDLQPDLRNGPPALTPVRTHLVPHLVTDDFRLQTQSALPRCDQLLNVLLPVLVPAVAKFYPDGE
jgi:hypothetical protein